jgi:hypothetical protein
MVGSTSFYEELLSLWREMVQWLIYNDFGSEPNRIPVYRRNLSGQRPALSQSSKFLYAD